MSEEKLFSIETLKSFMQEIIKSVEEKTSIVFNKKHIFITNGYNKSHRLGTCHREKRIATNEDLSSYNFVITIFNKHNITEEQVKGVITHELIHTLPYCFNHSDTFHYYGQMIKNKCGYNYGGRTTDMGEEFTLSNYKYFTYCPKCKKLHSGLNKKSRRITNPHNYICGCCGCEIESATKEEMKEILKKWKEEDM